MQIVAASQTLSTQHRYSMPSFSAKRDGEPRPKNERNDGQGGRSAGRGGWSGHSDSVGEGRLAGYRAVGMATLGILLLAGVGGVVWKIYDISQKATENNAMPFNQPGLQAELDKMNGVSPSTPATPVPSNNPPSKKGMPGQSKTPKRTPRITLKPVLKRRPQRIPITHSGKYTATV